MSARTSLELSLRRRFGNPWYPTDLEPEGSGGTDRPMYTALWQKRALGSAAGATIEDVNSPERFTQQPGARVHTN